jgi:SAM-dependent methyltransferase
METQAMKTARTLLGIALVVAVLELSHAGLAETTTPPRRPSIPYVATRNDTVQDMLWIANVGKDDVVYDLGSGDGRIVIAAVRDFGARRAVGIEIDPERIGESRKNTQKAGVTDRVEFIQGDLFTTDFRQASVVTLFLGHQSNIKLRPKMFSILKPGTRIVSHQYAMGEWQPDKTLISIWIVPAPVAGIWRGKIETEHGPQDLQLTLHQRLSEVTGTFQLSGKTNLTGGVHVDLWGSHMRCWCTPDRISYDQFELRFDGHVHENTMQGQLQERAWEAQRDKVDFAGTWEWLCASGQRSVKLRIERCDGHLIATYMDRDQTTPVTDFYDWGGGFYFALLIGREGDSLKITEDTGWLIGEGVLDHGALKGRIEFYPYGGTSDGPGERKAPQTVIQDWAPRLVKP